jgi:hypothetical protein
LAGSQDRLRSLGTLLERDDVALVPTTVRGVLEGAATVRWVLESVDDDEAEERLQGLVAEDLVHEQRQLSKLAEAAQTPEIERRLEDIQQLLDSLGRRGTRNAGTRLDELLCKDVTGFGPVLYGTLSRDVHGSYLDVVSGRRRHHRGLSSLDAIVLVRLALAGHAVAAKALAAKRGIGDHGLDGLGGALSDLPRRAIDQMTLGLYDLRDPSASDQPSP